MEKPARIDWKRRALSAEAMLERKDAIIRDKHKTIKAQGEQIEKLKSIVLQLQPWRVVEEELKPSEVEAVDWSGWGGMRIEKKEVLIKKCPKCGSIGQVDISPHVFFEENRIAYRCRSCHHIWEGEER